MPRATRAQTLVTEHPQLLQGQTSTLQSSVKLSTNAIFNTPKDAAVNGNLPRILHGGPLPINRDLRTVGVESSPRSSSFHAFERQMAGAFSARATLEEQSALDKTVREVLVDQKNYSPNTTALLHNHSLPTLSMPTDGLHPKTTKM